MPDYNEPAKGTEDWNVPINQNFSDLSIEVTDAVETWGDLPAPTDVEQSTNGQWPVYRVNADDVFVRVSDSSQEIIGGRGSKEHPLPEQHTESLRTGKVNNIEPWVIDGTSGGDIQDVIDAANAGDRVMVERANNSEEVYKTTQPVVIDKPLTVEGSLAVTGGEPHPDQDVSEMDGSVIEQQTAAEDVLQVTVSGAQVNLEGLGLTWESTIADSDTGHGVHALPPTASTGYEDGIYHTTWENLVVDGHDGDHYGYRIYNPQQSTFIGLHAYGGGHHEIVQDHAETFFGNSVFINPYVNILNAGSAAGIEWTTENGKLNLIEYHRPQVNHHAGAGTNPFIDHTENGQQVRTIHMYAVNLEGDSNEINFPDGEDHIFQEALNASGSAPPRNTPMAYRGSTVFDNDGVRTGAQLYEAATTDGQTIPNDSETKLAFNNGMETRFGWFDSANEKFVVDRESDYRIAFQAGFNDANSNWSAGDEIRLRPYINGNALEYNGNTADFITQKTATGRETVSYPTTKTHLNAGDEIEFYIRQRSGGDVELWANNALTYARVELM